MSARISIAGRAPWLAAPGLRMLLDALSQGGHEARIVGGAVRNTLFGEPVTDIDIATTREPAETIAAAEAAGLKAVPTGIDHGTVTVVADGHPYEVTTLRADTETDGRRAKVAFGRDWQTDAQRRDFTINALYADANGAVFDLVGGIDDIGTRTVRFIGSAEERIREDYLRILRFFRFFAWYGDGRPDAEGVRACARLKDGLGQLSAERVWAELRKLLAAPDPSRALLWMRQTGILSAVVPESEKWGIDAIHGVVAAGRDLGWEPDPMLRLEAIVPPDAARLSALAKRLKLSNAERDRLERFALTGEIGAGTNDKNLKETLYFGDAQAIADRLTLQLAAARGEGNAARLEKAANFLRLLDVANRWEKPGFPLGGDDLIALGMAPGKAMGDTLARLERDWVQSGFRLDRAALLLAAVKPTSDPKG